MDHGYTSVANRASQIRLDVPRKDICSETLYLEGTLKHWVRYLYKQIRLRSTLWVKVLHAARTALGPQGR